MIGDYAEIDVYCDHEGCGRIASVSLDLFSDSLDVSERAINEALMKLRGEDWIVEADGKHYCCGRCRDAACPNV
jgi:hypothetical protein